jgi:phage baseplate assembly protein W
MIQKKFYNIKLPFARDPNATYFELNKTEEDAASDDLKLLLLTGARERVMRPAYGVGMEQFVFEQDVDLIKTQLQAKITEQIRQLPNIQMNKILVKSYYDIDPVERSTITENTIVVQLFWQLKNIDNEEKTLELKLEI